MLFIALALGIFGGPLSAHAGQTAKVPRIGVLRLGSPGDPFVAAFRDGLRQLGYVEGQSIAIEYRWAEGSIERLPDLAAELVRSNVDVIVTGGAQPIRVLQRATSTIPIVVGVMSDPIRDGFAASFARPGGNITGLAFQNSELSTKRLQLIKEVLPHLCRLAILWEPSDASGLKPTEEAARSLGLKPQAVEVRGPDDLERAFGAARRGRAQALFQLSSPLLNAHRQRIADLAVKDRLPTTCETREFVAAGCLMAYGPSFPDMFRRAAAYVDKILKGANPADLPIEQPMRFEMVINLKTAKGLRLTIPPSVLFRADQIIQ